MSEYHGDIDLGDTIQWTFTTVDSTGLPTVLTGSPTATAYTDGGVTQSATGVTVTADFDGVVGLNLISIVATGGNGFGAGENIEIVLSAGTVDGVSVIGYAVGGFSISNRSPLRPTTIGRTLDVSAGGEAGLDWANIGSPTTAQNLSATNIDVDQVVASVSGAVGSVTGAVGSVTGAVASVTGAVGSVTGAVGSVTAAVTIDATSVDLIYDEAMVETTGAPAITGTFRAALEWMFALSRNKILQTATTTTLRNDADGADLATSTVSDDATTYTRGEWST